LKKKSKILTLAIFLTAVTAASVSAYAYYQYIPRILVDDTQILKENYDWQFDLFVLGNRNVNITVSTSEYTVYVTFWHQQNSAATTYLFDEQVTNTTRASYNVSVQQNGTYHLTVQAEPPEENVTTIVHVQIIS